MEKQMSANTAAENEMLQSLFSAYHTCSSSGTCTEAATALAICYHCEGSETICTTHRGELTSDSVMLFHTCKHACMVPLVQMYELTPG